MDTPTPKPQRKRDKWIVRGVAAIVLYLLICAGCKALAIKDYDDPRTALDYLSASNRAAFDLHLTQAAKGPWLLAPIHFFNYKLASWRLI